ncbi:hypothetical protein HHK36_004337 [Tetracentron sinense]|uniref:Uncharacterized protein n=1 Tax=Tetracentron sinense TaxID=13715 RepID=A0A835DPD7_TETSI|nr:hypothetical protein HHK36_004337 [Tetracentron sinense]
MEWASRMISGAMKLKNNNTVINIFLLGSFAALSIRSMSQQKNIEALESERDSLFKTNKAMKKAMWDWKQQLFAEATDSSPVPLSKLKAIYGEAPTQQSGEAVKEDAISSVPKFVV